MRIFEKIEKIETINFSEILFATDEELNNLGRVVNIQVYFSDRFSRKDKTILLDDDPYTDFFNNNINI